MKIDGRYEIRVVIVEVVGENTGGCYDSLVEFRKDNPDGDYLFAYIVFDTETQLVPDNCEDWNDSPEDALADYIEHVWQPPSEPS